METRLVSGFQNRMLLALVVQLIYISADKDTLSIARSFQKWIAYDDSDLPFDKSEGVYSFLNVLTAPQKPSHFLSITLADLQASLRIDPRYLSDPADLIPLRTSLRLTQRIVARMRSLQKIGK